MTFNRILLASAAGIVIVSATASYAADLPSRKAPIVYVAPAPVFTWTGAFIGVGLGGDFTSNKWTTTGRTARDVRATAYHNPAKLDQDSFRTSLYGGYNYQINNSFVVGVDADLGYAFDNKKTVNGVPGLSAGNRGTLSSKADWDGSLRGRFGYLITPSIMAYTAGGLAIKNVKYSENIGGVSGSSSDTRTGWTLGGGLEAQLWSNWVARAEYRYNDYGNKNLTLNSGTAQQISAKTKLSEDVVTLGLAYKFGM
ncbi:outer membrane protein [Methylovirgula sp. 4M-Z18]|uniref:outer membrane protein n=1 Tax=Methylovirgula sp. 4M-Z18 TaxID=2293567 RepID=UPI000E2EBF54|nr:outer membrane protein [Methylovirgula sp. 4M-Z18]RFB80243.1 porin family protein [Methylovirgula sp. 4M-Z18]